MELVLELLFVPQVKLLLRLLLLPGYLKNVLGDDEVVEWFKALSFLRSDRCCLRIESAKCSFHLLR